jgi:hypothetical protein
MISTILTFMSEHRTNGTHSADSHPITNLKILQLNLNKLIQAHLELINKKLSTNWDIILIQEPHVTTFNYIRTPINFRQVYPADRGRDGTKVRSAIWVNKKLETKYWKIIDIPDTNDITAIQIKGTYGKLTIFNIYNDCNHSQNEGKLQMFIRANLEDIYSGRNNHMIWAGDFNRHHPLWDKSEDTHLFTKTATEVANRLIDLLGEFGMEMALPHGIPTLEHMHTKKYSRPDNFFCTQLLKNHIISCDVDAKLRPPATDHLPILTIISLPQARVVEPPSYNFRNVEWEDFRKNLASRLEELSEPTPIMTEGQLHERIKELTNALQDTIRTRVATRWTRLDSKRWWNSDLKKLKKELNKLRTESFKLRALTHHPIHAQCRSKSNQYREEIVRAKRQH